MLSSTIIPIPAGDKDFEEKCARRRTMSRVGSRVTFSMSIQLSAYPRKIFSIGRSLASSSMSLSR